MVDEPNSNDTPLNDPLPEPQPQVEQVGDDGGDAPRIKRRRPVYEPTLFEDKKRFRVPRYVAIPSVLVLCGVAFFSLVIAPKQRHHFDTFGKVVYSGDPNSSGQTHLFLANGDGSGTVADLSPGSGSDSQPAFAPDGNQIAFISTRDSSTKQLYTIDPDGGNRLQLTHNVGVKSSPEYAPVDHWGSLPMNDCDTIGYISSGILYTVSASTLTRDAVLPVLTKQSQSGTSDQSQDTGPVTVTSYAWSPDKAPNRPWWSEIFEGMAEQFGWSRSALSQQGLAAVEETNGMDQLAILPSLDADPISTVGTPPNTAPIMPCHTMSLTWAPDDKTIAVAALGLQGLPNDAKFSGIVFIDRNGHPLQQPPLFGIPNDQIGPQSPVYRPDGSFLVCQVLQQPDIMKSVVQGLGFVKLDGSAPPTLAIPGDISQPKFSSDGKYLYFLQAMPNGNHALRRADMVNHTIANVSNASTDVTAYDISPQ